MDFEQRDSSTHCDKTPRLAFATAQGSLSCHNQTAFHELNNRVGAAHDETGGTWELEHAVYSAIERTTH